MQLKLDGDLRTIFLFDSGEARSYAALRESFPDIESDIALLVEGEPLSPGLLTRLVQLETRLTVIPQVVGTLSLLDLPEIRNSLTDPDTLELAQSIDNSVAAQIRGIVQKRHQLSSMFIGDSGNLQRLIIQVDRSILEDVAQLATVTDRIYQVATATFGDTARLHMSGFPVMKPALRQNTADDLRIFAASGVLLAFLLSVLIFRQFRAALIMSVGPATGVIWTLGLMGWAGESITVFSAALPPLLFVIGYASAAHIVLCIQRLTDDAGSAGTNNREDLARVYRACVVSAITTGIGFASLYFVGAEPVKRFGIFAAIGCVLTCTSVMLLTPLICRHLFRPIKVLSGNSHTALMQRFFRLGRFASRRSIPLVVAGSLLTALAMVLAAQVRPDFQFRENFSPGSAFFQAVSLGDRQFGGAFSLKLLTSWPADEELSVTDFLELQGRLEDAAREIFNTDRVVGASWLERAGNRMLISSSGGLEDIGQGDLLRRFVDPEAGRSVIFVPIADLGSRELLPAITAFRLDSRQILDDYPGYQVNVTGLAFLALHGSNQVIADIARSLGMAVLAIFLVVSVALRSPGAGLICMVPNILPVAGVAAIMVIFGLPLQYTSVLVFAICLGVAVDDSVHLMMRERLVGSNGLSQPVEIALGQVGPALVFSTLITVTGFGALVFSNTASIASVGYLSICALALGLLADLLFLPALLVLWRRLQ